MQPMRKTTKALNKSAHTGTRREEWMTLIYRENKMPSSRANDQVSREAVCWQPLTAKKAETIMQLRKTVAAAEEEVAWYQIS